MLHLLIYLGEHFGHVGNVPVAHVGGEDGVEGGPFGQGTVESQPHQRVVGLAAEPVRAVDLLEDVFGAGDARSLEVVDDLIRADAFLHYFAESGGQIDGVVGLGQQGFEVLRLEEGRVVGLEALGAALFPVAEEVAHHLGAPSDPAFQEAEAQVGEAMGDPAEEDRLGGGLTGGAEVAHVVVGEVAD